MSAPTVDWSMQDLHARVARPDFDRWRAHVTAAAGCSHPIRLHGEMFEVEGATGRIVRSAATQDMPDGAIYVPCGNRRATVCASCSETYRADTFQLVRAGLAGGKGVPESVTRHPCVFFTPTAPSFGPVHTHHRDGKPCRPRRTAQMCPHGVALECRSRHADDDSIVGTPLCSACYDYDHQVVWNGWVGELWRRTTIRANRELRRLGDRFGIRLRLSYAKVAEFQRRGVVHIHSMIRLDAVDPDDPDAVITPPPGITSAHLAQLVHTAAAATSFTTDPHPEQPAGWLINWGEQLDTREVRLTVRDIDDAGEITAGAVAGYLAKYATKATEDAGHASTRLTSATVHLFARRDTHPGRLVAATWRLGGHPRGLTTDERDEWDAGYGRLRRWAHMLGFGGHFSTKSRRYSTTLGALRLARRAWRRAQLRDTGPDRDDRDQMADDDAETTVLVNVLSFAGMGWRTSADALLANSAAARAREQRQIAREESTTHYPT